ncbi:MAG: ATP-binding protein [Spirochaetes bacterium GWF1_41_5]|nr:MAG: ATP-binding protein [Spirochaetes bacterium GWF1_41_5]HBE03673.1 ATP-binding protein [Spirochaetia bacterium]
MDPTKTLIVDENNPCWETHGMYFREFPSDPKLVRYYTILVIQKAPAKWKEKNLLEQQLSEIIKNAIYHGNKKDKSKKIKIWFSYGQFAKFIIEDEGEGFKELEQWNKFNQERLTAFASGDFEKMSLFVSFRTDKSTDDDGGNSLFAAIEYWNMGMIYNSFKNKVCAMRRFDEI